MRAGPRSPAGPSTASAARTSWHRGRRVEIDEADRSGRQSDLEFRALTARVSTNLEVCRGIELDAHGLHEIVEQSARIVILSAPDLVEVAYELECRHRSHA